MYTSRTARRLASFVTVATLTIAACAGDDASTATEGEPSAAASAPPTTDPIATTPDPTEPASTAPPTTDGVWRQQVEDGCNAAGPSLAAIVGNDGTAESIAAEAQATKAVFEQSADAAVAMPAELHDAVDTLASDAIAHLDSSIELAGAGNLVAAQDALEEGFDRLSRTATTYALGGARCGPADPVRVANADLTVPLEMDPNHLWVGFGSVWASERLANRVVRLDPQTGEVQATIDVGEFPLKLQPADGRMWVRTAKRYVAIDEATNTVVATLDKADVGPAAFRSWAVDGAMWICDGRTLHRYDPTTLAAVAALDAKIDCNNVYATPDMVVVWSYNEDVGESGTSAATFVDPATNTVLATVALPVDVGGPALLPGGTVFFPGYHGTKGVVVDTSTWTVTDTPDLGIAGGGAGQPVFDGESIYVVTADEVDVLRVDSTTFEVTDIIEPLAANSIALDEDGNLWVARGQPIDAIQRFDVSS